MEPTRRAIMIYGHKGGVGKSIFGAALLDFFRRYGIPCAAFDTDFAIRHLHQYYGSRTGDPKVQDDPLTGVSLVDLHHPRERDGLINILDRKYPLILLDMPAGGAKDLQEGFGLGSAKALVDEYANCGYRITIATVITPIYAASEAVGLAWNTFQRDVDHVVVKNLCFGEENEFPFFDGLQVENEWTNDRHKKAVLASGGEVILLPKLRADTFALVDKYALSFTQALTDETLLRADRSRVHQWREETVKQIRKASHLLGIERNLAA